MKYSIIVPAYNSEKTIGKCIKSILQSKFNKRHELIVVDDCSNDRTATIAKSLGARVIINKKNRGPSFSRNRGAWASKCDIIVFVDSDVLVTPDTLAQIDSFLQKNLQYSALSCAFSPKSELKDIFSTYKHSYMVYCLKEQKRDVTWAFTSTFAIMRDALKDVGGFNEKVRMNEDDLLGRELVKKRHRIAFARHIEVEHLHRYSFKAFIKGEFQRSNALTVMKLTDKFGNNIMKKNNSGQLVYSIFIFPFVILGLLLAVAQSNSTFIIVPLAAFYLINVPFLIITGKTYGLKHAFASTMIIPIDSLVCGIGAGRGVLQFMGGKRI